MFDPKILPVTRKVLDIPARLLVRAGISADQVTVAGFFIGLLAVPLLAFQYYELALVAILLNRVSDGLDGAVARRTQLTDAGGYIDIVLDFIFYSAVVFGFLLAVPEQNAIAAGVLLVTFMGTGATFLAFASVAGKRGIENPDYPNKSLHYMGGLTEGFETIMAFVAFCLWPQHFSVLAYVFATACWVTAITRIVAGYRTLKQPVAAEEHHV
ncbi:CDP-alcohol phosphatidyltransferase family protein [Idiomarina abyssalis]|uniref:CDP-alcohol phosphatidyltransferase family protein n=3 Tax=Idiomarina abyssalis TaxID=86102 RepID=A0A8I1KDR9_9GAMM|nr:MULTISPECIES: CDP-alcohol phosphatidyltransferase family protein [Idiomarina]MBJ7274049.1 CDP-alcohol phosphatidyltransferase family protein [Idiomarina abyssalis]MBJ7315241.1 CDP-alcohol phosphatidyltransferase family protein [Idiomarina abyssalis]RDX35142.1 CDP-alcohol phosphatidyltransferase family protein [Idiomarina sp. HD9-110m-PIT-SAG05]|tara:strand:- start:4770 stop:5405 length:636 start_codon:yes stop_codon:yes gene_type:complete